LRLLCPSNLAVTQLRAIAAIGLDVLKCAKCGSRRRWIAAIASPEVIVRVLEYLGLASVMPTPAPARASPQGELVFS